MDSLSLKVTDAPDPADLSMIGERLTAFNDADAGPSNRVPLAVLVHDADDGLVAGISGYTGWGWLYIQWLWVAEAARGQKLAGRMIAAAEDEARKRGCHGAYIDTFNPTALKAYERAGYAAFGALKDFPPGRTRTFLEKRL